VSTAAILLAVIMFADVIAALPRSRHKRHDELYQRIVGPSSELTGNWSWFVSLPGCGGSLISPQWVVTAALCIHDEGTQIGSIARMGSSYRDGRGSKTCLVKRIVQHPDYNDVTYANDVALVELDCTVQYTRTISAIALPTATDGIRDSDDTRVHIAGFGLQNETDTRYAVQLREVSMKTVNAALCGKAIQHSIDNSMMCAYAPGRGSCGGDSGGPVVVQYSNTFPMRFVLYGIVLFSRGCAREGVPTVFHHLPSSVNWIRSVTGIDNDDISAPSDEQLENVAKPLDEQPSLDCWAGVRCFGHTSTSLVGSVGQCSSECASESTCKAATFQPASSETNNGNICFKFTSGYHCSRDGHDDWTSCGDIGMDRYRCERNRRCNYYYALEEKNFTQCMNWCDNDDSCQCATFDQTSQKCYKFDTGHTIEDGNDNWQACFFR